MKKTKAITPRGVKKPVGAIHIDSGELTLTQKKVWNLLLWHYYAQNPNNATYEMPMTEITKYLRYEKRNDMYVLNTLKKLAQIQLGWDLLEDGKRRVGFAQLLADADIIEGNLSYSLSPKLKKLLLKQEVYSLLNLSIVRLFRSKYALALYENCYRFIRTGTTGEWSIDLFRELIGVPKKTKKYNTFGELRRSIIDPAVREINDISNIKIEAHYKKNGRTVKSVSFTVQKRKSTIPLSSMKIDDSEEAKKTRRKIIKIKKLIDDMGLDDRANLVNKFYKDEIKESPTLIALYKESGLSEFLIKIRIEWFEKNLLNADNAL